MSRKMYGFKIRNETREQLNNVLTAKKDAGEVPPATSASWIVDQLIAKYNKGEITL